MKVMEYTSPEIMLVMITEDVVRTSGPGGSSNNDDGELPMMIIFG